MSMHTIIFNEFTLKTIKNNFYLGITVCVITGRNSAAKIVSQSFRNNGKIVIYKRYYC